MIPLTNETTAARTAQHWWAAQSVRQRLGLIRQLRRHLLEQRQALWEAVQADTGRSPVEVLASELLPIASALRFLERRAAKLLSPRRVAWRDRPLWLWGCHDIVYRRPWGIVGIIGTWNYPLFLNIVPIAQALTAGNAILWKPSEQTPCCADAIARLLAAAGCPAHLFQVLPVTREAGPLLAEADVDLVLFTGSEGVGRQLARRLGERLIPSVLELSGCDPMWVFPDADVHLAARAAWFGTTFNRGQTCIAVRRIFVHRAVAEAFRVALHEVLEAAAATGTGQSCTLQTPAQVAQFHRLVRDALARGALLLTPYGQSSARGIDRESPSAESAASTAEPSTCQPTWLWNVPPDAAVLQESCFAPLAAVVIVDSLEQALTLTRQCRFGLAASLFSGDVRQAQQWAAHLPAGQVCVNDVLVPTAHPATPFGGRGASGWGVTQGAEGLLTLTVPQVVTVRRGRWRPHYDEAIKSHPAASQEMLEGLLLMSHAPTWRGRWQGVLRLLRGLRHR